MPQQPELEDAKLSPEEECEAEQRAPPPSPCRVVDGRYCGGGHAKKYTAAVDADADFAGVGFEDVCGWVASYEAAGAVGEGCGVGVAFGGNSIDRAFSP